MDKKAALIPILRIIREETDDNTIITQSKIKKKLEDDYNIKLERRAISDYIDILGDLGYDVIKGKKGCRLNGEFDETELRVLVDGVLGSKHIDGSISKGLIEKIVRLGNKKFKLTHKHIYSVGEWNNTENKQVFLNVSLVDEAIDKGKQITFEFYKYDINKDFIKSSDQVVSPYQLLMKNGRYYLFGFDERHNNFGNYRFDHIKNVKLLDDTRLTPLTSHTGYKKGIDYKIFSTQYPYMYADKPQRIKLKAKKAYADRIIEEFGKDITISVNKEDHDYINVYVLCSPNAMKVWALQFLDGVEVVSPRSLREDIKSIVAEAAIKYK